jgi:hypothetical protein
LVKLTWLVPMSPDWIVAFTILALVTELSARTRVITALSASEYDPNEWGRAERPLIQRTRVPLLILMS